MRNTIRKEGREKKRESEGGERVIFALVIPSQAIILRVSIPKEEKDKENGKWSLRG